MKKFLYFCILLTTCLNAMSQIDPYDNNWGNRIPTHRYSLPYGAQMSLIIQECPE